MSNENNDTSGTSSGTPPAESFAASAFRDATANDWMAKLALHKSSGAVLPTLQNLYLILSNDHRWYGVIATDQFSGQVVKRRDPPFAQAEVGEWSDLDDRRTTLWLSQHYAIEPKKDVLFDAVELVADSNRFHRVREYLSALAWDGVPRAAHWLTAFMGAESSPYTEAIGARWLVSAVARVFRPGVKADNVLILEGAQGLLKSTALSVLGGDWFTDAPFKIGEKDGYQIIRGKWIVELAELDSFNKATSDAAKLFFSQSTDRYRTPWGKRPSDVPRQCVFAGTVNHSQYFRDDTGNRRYWPVQCTRVDIDELRAERDQIWAEAVQLFSEGAIWWARREEEQMFGEQQEARYIGDAWETTIARYLEDNIQTAEFSTAKILTDGLGLDTSKWSKVEQQRVGHIMARLGWPRVRQPKPPREWLYVRPPRATTH
jgi:putative DNA primase/helicase